MQFLIFHLLPAFVATVMMNDYIFANRPTKLYGITAGFYIISLTLMGAILGAWGV